MSRVTDAAGAATLGLARKFIDPRITSSEWLTVAHAKS
jgi:hypothetical protein